MSGPLLAAFALLLPPTVGQPAAAPGFLVVTADGTLPAAPLLAMADDFGIRRGGEVPRSIAAGDLLALRQGGRPLPSGPEPPFVLLSSGERLPLAGPPELHPEDEQLLATPANPL